VSVVGVRVTTTPPGTTCTLLLTLLTRLPLVPVTVKTSVASAAEVVAESVSVDVPEPVIVAGLKLPLIPVGRLGTVSLTLPVKPSTAVSVIVKAAVPPCGRGSGLGLKMTGDAVMVKSLAAVTLTDAVPHVPGDAVLQPYTVSVSAEAVAGAV
jgi:hypothetical protein